MPAAVLGTLANNNAGGDVFVQTFIPLGNWAASGSALITGHPCFGSSLFLAGSGSSLGQVASSPDGVTWTNRVTGLTANGLIGVWSFGGTHFALGQGVSPEIATSTNGTTWTKRTLPNNTTNSPLNAVGYDSSTSTHMIGGGDGGTSCMWTSTDGGVTWSSITPPTAGNIVMSLCSNNAGTWIAYVTNGFWYMSTNAGGSWSLVGNINGSTGQNAQCIYANGKFMLIYSSGFEVRTIYSEDDGASWFENVDKPTPWMTQGVPVADSVIQSVDYVNGVFVAQLYLSAGNAVMMYSPDGFHWKITAPCPSTNAFTGVAFGASKYLLSSNSTSFTSYTSTDPSIAMSVAVMSVTVRGGTGTTITDPANWTLLGSQVNSTTVLAQKVYWRPLMAASTPGLALPFVESTTITSAKASSAVVALGGVDASVAPIAAEIAGQANASSLTVTYPTLGTFPSQNGIDLAFGGIANADTTTAPTNYTNGASSQSTGGSAATRTTSGVAYRSVGPVTTVGSLTAAWTGTAAVNIGQHVFLREAPPPIRPRHLLQARHRASAI